MASVLNSFLNKPFSRIPGYSRGVKVTMLDASHCACSEVLDDRSRMLGTLELWNFGYLLMPVPIVVSPVEASPIAASPMTSALCQSWVSSHRHAWHFLPTLCQSRSQQRG